MPARYDDLVQRESFSDGIEEVEGMMGFLGFRDHFPHRHLAK